MRRKMGATMEKTQIGLSCESCGCIRQVRTKTHVQTPLPGGAKTVYTYIKTACPACGAETEHMVFTEPGWTVQDGNRQVITCPCGSTLFLSPLSPRGEPIERGIFVSFHELVCASCEKEGVVFVFSGSSVLTDQERQEVLAAGAS